MVYSFHNGTPVVPSLAMMRIKRLWSDELENSGIRQELERDTPGLMELLNDGQDVPFNDLLDAHYQMVYMDQIQCSVERDRKDGRTTSNDDQ
jgi:hypothetical protein